MAADARIKLVVLLCALRIVVGIDLHSSLPRLNSGSQGNAASLSPLASWVTSIEHLGFQEVDSLGLAGVKPSDGPPAKRIQNIPIERRELYFRPVSTTLRCVVVMTSTSVLFYTLLSISRNVDELSATFTPSVWTQTLTIAARVTAFAPMMCVLFVGCRMYVLATTQGLGEPQPWVKRCMWTAVGGMLLQFVNVLLLPMVARRQAQDAQEEAAYDMTGGRPPAWKAQHATQEKHDDTQPPHPHEVEADVEEGARAAIHDATGEHNDVHPVLKGVEYRKTFVFVPYILWLLQLLSVLITYLALGGVVIGIVTFPAQSTNISPAVLCTLWLVIQYMLVCLLLWIARSLPVSETQRRFTNAALAMSSVVRKAPMFAVVFLASRQRALQLNPPHGMPSFTMQCCFYLVTAFLSFETLAAGFVGGFGRMHKAYYGVYIFRVGSRALHIFQHTCAFVTYGALDPLIYMLLLMKDPATGASASLSASMQCVCVLIVIYFSLNLVLDLILFAEEAMGKELPMTRDTIVSGGISFGLAPSLCLLFVATRMRALQITKQTGDPPGWAQECMYVAVFAICVQSLCCLVTPLFVGKACKVDMDGNPDYDLKPMVGAYAVCVVKYVSLMSLHLSVFAVCVSVFTMSPETAHGHERMFLSVKLTLEAIAMLLFVFFIALLLSSAKVVGLAFKFAIEACGNKKLLGVNVTVRFVALNVFRGYIKVRDLVVHQPEHEIIYTRDDDGALVKSLSLTRCEWKCEYLAKFDSVLIKINMSRFISTLWQEVELENLTVKGIHVNLEKPDPDASKSNSNIEYVLNHIEHTRPISNEELNGETDDPLLLSSEKDEGMNDQKKGEEETEQEENEEHFGLDMPKIFLHKIALGNVDVLILLRGLSMIGDVRIHPKLGLLEFDDVHEEVLGGKWDLTPGQTVACIIKAIASKIFHKVYHEIPHHIAANTIQGIMRTARGCEEGVAMGLEKLTGVPL